MFVVFVCVCVCTQHGLNTFDLKKFLFSKYFSFLSLFSSWLCISVLVSQGVRVLPW